MLGSNIRLESALLNARIKFMHQNSSLIGIIMGSFSDVNIPSVFCSLNLTNIIKIFEARFINTPFILNNSVKTVLFIGDSFFSRSYNTNTFINFLKNKFINILTLKVLKSSNSDGLNFLNIKKNYYNKQDSIVTINPKENIITNKTISKKKNDNIYIGDQGSFVAAQHKYIVPTTNIYESDYKYLNYEHRCQKTTQIFTYINQSKKLSNLLLTMFNKNKSLVNLWSNHLEENILFPEKYVSIINNFLLETNKKYIFFHSERTKFFNYPIKLSIKNFYLSSKSSSYSKIMKSCSQELHKNFKLFY
jgi:NADH dehydrogenase/NADH:ubiquinone oxidoreductase subunit G